MAWTLGAVVHAHPTLPNMSRHVTGRSITPSARKELAPPTSLCKSPHAVSFALGSHVTLAVVTSYFLIAGIAATNLWQAGAVAEPTTHSSTRGARP